MISVVIPVYNHALYVADAIHSCLLCPEVTEILIADDGSSDGSPDIIRMFAEKFPDIIKDLTDVPATNIGAHNRINLLCASANNEWISILNSDDRYEPGRFRSLDRYTRYSGCDLIFGNCAIIGPDNQHLGFKYATYSPEFSYPDDLLIDEIARNNDWLLALLNQNFVATTSNMVFKKSLFESLGGFAAYRYIHDWEFLLRAAAAVKVAYNPNMWVNYRIHPTNTISENTFKVREEVRAMFAEVLGRQEMKTALNARYTSDMVRSALSGNQYLINQPTLAIIAEEAYHPAIQELSKALPGTQIFDDIKSLPTGVQFIYAPENLGELLCANDIVNLILALSVGKDDFCICTLELNHRDTHNAKSLRDITIWRADVARVWLQGVVPSLLKGRVVQIPRQSAVSSKLLTELFPLGCKIHQTRGDLTVTRPSEVSYLRRASSGLASVQPSDILSQSDKTTVFVFPSLVAVGGAENVLIEVMNQLQKEYDFVLICTEPLSATQGSWVGRALEHAVAYYDVTEFGPPECYMGVLTWLKAAYTPELLFITNGSLWQMHNFGQLRRLFRDCAIVDQQAYDARFGWINWLKYPSVKAADRYIAVNKRIEARFLNEFGLPPDIVDLIPHPIDAERIVRNLAGFKRRSSLEKFGLPDNKPIIAFVGRITEQKRPLLFLDLASRAQAEQLDLQFVMVGQGNLATTVNETIQRLDLRNVIRIENADPLEELYSVTDLLVITSEYEGLPLAMLEAMSAGVPIFAVDAGDIGIVLGKYVQEETFSPELSADLIYQALQHKLSTLQQAKIRATKAAEKVRNDFSGEEISKLYRDTFQKAVDKYRSTRRFY